MVSGVRTIMYEICRVARAFDPNFASVHLTPAFVDAMQAITPLAALGLLSGLKQELPAYLAAAAQAPIFGRTSVADYTEEVLTKVDVLRVKGPAGA